MDVQEDDNNKPSSIPNLLAALASGARAVHGLPLEDDFAFESSFPEFSKALGETQSSLLQTLSSALHHTSKDTAADDAAGGLDVVLEPETYQNIQDPLLWDACADACEALIDKVEAFLKSDEAIVDDENVALATGALNDLATRARQRAKSTLGRLVESTVEMEKPQVTYQMDVTSLNDRREPFVPLVHPDKPFAVTPLDLSLKEGHGLATRYGPLRENVRVSDTVVAPAQHVPHVYEKEITSLEYRPWQLEATKPQGEIPIPTTLEATWVDSVQGLQELQQQLEQVQEVAIDLEHHSYRSFAGILCLMQISFRTAQGQIQNYLIDVFPVWKQINAHLAPMFANPDIVKVMHGADSDIQWLQRDFGIYVVNLFDTGRAARALGLAKAGLAFILQKYAKVQADKTHQLSDWRQRPLPEAMRHYAISDTHYLLDVYDRIKWDLAQSKTTSIEEVLDTSRKVCLIRYAKDPFQPMGYKHLTRQRTGGRTKTELNPQQEQVLEKLWSWRDQTARNCDESPVYVCSNAVLLRISLSSPTTVTALQALLNPIPPLILHYATAVTQIVRKVRTNANLVSLEASSGQQQKPAVGAPSSAFFKPAERTASEDVRRAGVLSPVLGTEALYKQAGWITPLSSDREVRRLVEAQQVVPIATTTEEEGDSDAGTGPTPVKPRNLLSVNRSNKDYRAQQQTSHSLGMGNKDSGAAAADGRRSSAGGRTKTADGVGAARAAREHSQSPVPALTVEQEMKVAQHDAALIHSGIARKEEMLGLISPPPLDAEEEDLDVDEEPSRPRAGDEAEKIPGGTTGENEEEFVIPRSMREIYKISNRNRRNKKVSSPTPDRPTVPTNEAEMEHLAKAEKLLKARGLDGKGYFDESSKSPGKRQRTKSAGTDEDGGGSGSQENSVTREEDMMFMQEIGWIKNKEEADKLMGQGAAAAATSAPESEAAASNEAGVEEDIADDEGGGNTGNKGNRDTKTPPTFDYSSVGGMGALNPQPQQGVANPFFSGAALTGGPLTQGGTSSKSDRKKNSSGSSRGGKQGRNRQERPEKRDGKTHAYRKR